MAGDHGVKNPRLYPRLWDHSYLCLSDLRDAVAQVAPQFRGDIVDYGAGSKPYRELFREAKSYRGADFVIHDEGDILLPNEVDLPLADGSVDHVLSFQVFEHVDSPQRYLQECHRVLKPGGTVLLTTHGTWCFHPGPKNGDFWRWTHDGLSKTLADCGFRVEECRALTPGWRCLLQQALVLRDPFRHEQSWMRTLGSRLASVVINSLGILLQPIRRTQDSKCDILPIGYLVIARKS